MPTENKTCITHEEFIAARHRREEEMKTWNSGRSSAYHALGFLEKDLFGSSDLLKPKEERK